MAQTGYTPIKLYASSTAAAVPLAANLDNTNGAELAINITDGKLYYKDNAGVVKLIASTSGASGDVVGPASATDNAIARFDLTTGKLIQNSVVTIADSTGDMAGVGTLSSGAITTTGVLTLPAGSVSAPAITTTGDTNTGIFFPAADTIAFTEGGAESMRITSAGDVGIGTTSPNLNSFNKELTVSAGTSGTARAAINIQGSRTTSATFGALSFFHQANNVGSIEMLRGGADNSGVMQFFTANAGTIAERMRIDSAGNVGIGTSSPSSLLNVSGTGASGLLRINRTDGAGFIDINSSNGVAGASIGSTGTQGLQFYTNYSTSPLLAMSIDSSGNVGIGTSSPNGSLTVSKQITALSGTGNTYGVHIYPTATGQCFIDGLSNSSSNSSLGLRTYNNGTYTEVINNFAGNTTVFQTAGTERMRIDSSGNVGIGTSSPASKLDVVGTASFSGTMGVGAFAAAPETGLNVRFIGNLTSTDIAGVSVSISAPATASNSTNGVYSSLRTTAASGARGILSSFYAEQPSIGAGSSVTAANGILVRNQGNAAIAAAYGVRIEGQSGSALNYGIYNESSSRFDGNIGLNTAPSGSGTGITFPATQSASTNANTLDDYEEGTWTPVLRGSGIAGTYVYDTARTGGQYVKIGRQVMIRGVVSVTSVTSAGTNDAQITGIPFISTNLASSWVRAPGNLLCQGGTTANANSSIFCGFGTGGSATLDLYTQSTTDIAGIPVTTVDDVNSIWSFTYTYYADN
jgi:hypothetical protein